MYRQSWSEFSLAPQVPSSLTKGHTKSMLYRDRWFVHSTSCSKKESLASTRSISASKHGLMPDMLERCESFQASSSFYWQSSQFIIQVTTRSAPINCLLFLLAHRISCRILKSDAVLWVFFGFQLFVASLASVASAFQCVLTMGYGLTSMLLCIFAGDKLCIWLCARHLMTSCKPKSPLPSSTVVHMYPIV